jgi:hypothetical protein
VLATGRAGVPRAPRFVGGYPVIERRSIELRGATPHI